MIRSRPAPVDGDVRGHGDEHGAVGGVEVLPFGVLVFVALVLLIANLWAVVDAKMTVDAAAREAGRAFVEAPDLPAARAAARRAADDVARGAGRDPARLRLEDDGSPFLRCSFVEHRASYQVPSITLPFIGGFGRGFEVRGRHRESIDAFREGLPGEGICG